MEIFTIEYIQLQENNYIQKKSSSLKSLCPYLDNKSITRAKGRLEKAQITENRKHPVILPHSSYLTCLIIADAHGKSLHGGHQVMINYLRSGYWIRGMQSLETACTQVRNMYNQR